MSLPHLPTSANFHQDIIWHIQEVHQWRVRRSAGAQTKRLEVGNLVLDDERHIVTVNGENCELTFKEYDLLKLLMSNCGMVLTREVIMERVWGTDFEGESRTLDMHIKTLRQKLGEEGSMIRTVRNVGYLLEKD